MSKEMKIWLTWIGIAFSIIFLVAGIYILYSGIVEEKIHFSLRIILVLAGIAITTTSAGGLFKSVKALK